MAHTRSCGPVASVEFVATSKELGALQTRFNSVVFFDFKTFPIFKQAINLYANVRLDIIKKAKTLNENPSY